MVKSIKRGLIYFSLFIGGLAFLILGILAIGIYMEIRVMPDAVQAPTTQTQPIATSLPTQPPDEIPEFVRWRSQDEFNLEIQYPYSWTRNDLEIVPGVLQSFGPPEQTDGQLIAGVSLAARRYPDETPTAESYANELLRLLEAASNSSLIGGLLEGVGLQIEDFMQVEQNRTVIANRDALETIVTLKYQGQHLKVKAITTVEGDTGYLVLYLADVAMYEVHLEQAEKIIGSFYTEADAPDTTQPTVANLPPADTSEFVSYKNDEYGLSLRHPRDWSSTEITRVGITQAVEQYPYWIDASINLIPELLQSFIPSDSITVDQVEQIVPDILLLFGPSQAANDLLAGGVSIAAWEYPPELQLEGYADGLLSLIKYASDEQVNQVVQMLDLSTTGLDVGRVELNETTIAGMPAIEVVATLGYQGQNLKGAARITVNNRMAYLVMYLANTGTYDDAENLARAVIESLQITSDEAPPTVDLPETTVVVPPPDEIPGYNTHTDLVHNLELQYPQEWESTDLQIIPENLRRNTPLEDLRSFGLPPDANGQLKGGVSLAIQEFPGTVREYTEELLGLLELASNPLVSSVFGELPIEDFTQVQQSGTTLTGSPAIETEVTLRYQGRELRGLATTTVRDGMGYLMLYLADAETYDDLLDDAQMVIGSFYIDAP